MDRLILKEQGKKTISEPRPHLSFSRINRYLLCPEQYRLYYVENLRPKIPPASLVFGKIIHSALDGLFSRGEDPIHFFHAAWGEVKQIDVRYSSREAWEKLHTIGQVLLEKFLQEELPGLGTIKASEKTFELNVTGFSLPLIGVIDLITETDGKEALTDFKTAAASYEEHEVILSDQLSTYKLAEPDAEQAALCVFVKTKEPRIEWYRSRRDPEILIEYLEKIHYVAHEIVAGRFYKRPGKWCSYCDYLPVCLGEKKKMEETLIQIKLDL